MSSHDCQSNVVRVWRRDEGQDLLEYAILMSLIAIVAMGAVTSVGDAITTFFWNAIDVAVAAV